MVSTSEPALPDQVPGKRPGSGVAIDPGKLTWWRANRGLERDELSALIANVARAQGILDARGEPVTYSRDAIAKLENGERKPKMPTFRSLCAALECKPEDLLEDFPGTQRSPGVPDAISYDEMAEVLGDCDDPVSVLNLSTRSWNSLVQRGGFTTVGEIVAAGRDGTLGKVKMLGFVQAREIRDVLAAYAEEKAEEAGPDVAEAS